jgi:cysteine desulfurase/selenocysteine lyase
VAQGLPWATGDAVLTSGLEHNSNLLPWQRLVRERGVRHLIAPLHPDTRLQLERLEALVRSPGLRLVSVLACSNVTGVSFPVREIVDMAHAAGVPVLLDAAQAGLHTSLDLASLGVDYCALSSHKMLGPTGFGMLYVRRERLEGLRPLLVGGETVVDASYEHARLAPAPDRFEAGLQDYAGALGAAEAARYLAGLGPEAVHRHLVALNLRASERVAALPGLRILGPADPAARAGILNMVIDGIPARDLARVLDASHGLMLRSGRQCAHAWYGATGTPDSLRASFGPYNTAAEVDLLCETLEQVLRHFR